MISRSNKAFTLLEVLIALVILSTAIVFIFRSVTSSLYSAKFSQNITGACFFAENKIWEMEEEQRAKAEPIENRQGSQKIQGKDFRWTCQTKRLGSSNLVYLEFIVYWQESLREKEYVLEFDTYLLSL
ncbi:MAG: type II secretion system minor pseudopilin GspI [Candidatus Omnitrophica bacterium]|nr:type II secretion system minor pseudopilin GspI [Candidatus Omnitrophota bacterium]